MCSDHTNLLKETLEKQFELVKQRTSRNGSYVQGSHVLQFGTLDIDEEAVGDYLGEANTGEIYYSICTMLHMAVQCNSNLELALCLL